MQTLITTNINSVLIDIVILLFICIICCLIRIDKDQENLLINSGSIG